MITLMEQHFDQRSPMRIQGGGFVTNDLSWCCRLGAGGLNPSIDVNTADAAAALGDKTFAVTQARNIDSCRNTGLHDALACLYRYSLTIDLDGKGACQGFAHDTPPE